MNEYFEAAYDRLAGYVFLCWICRRPVFTPPPKFSWLLDVFVADNDELEIYLRSLRVKYDQARIGRDSRDDAPPPTTRKFSDIAKPCHKQDAEQE